MPPRGILVSIDGPGGAGKTTVISHLAAQFGPRGAHRSTPPPNRRPAHRATGQIPGSPTPRAGNWPACSPPTATSACAPRSAPASRPDTSLVVCDRYLASGLVVQRMDGIDLPFLTAINRHVDLPDLAVISGPPRRDQPSG